MSSFTDLLDDVALARLVRETNPRLAARLDREAVPDDRSHTGGDAWINQMRDPVARARETQAAAQSGARLAKAMGEAEALVMVLKPPPPTRAQCLEQARTRYGNLMAKAMTAFQAGEVTAEQVQYL